MRRHARSGLLLALLHHHLTLLHFLQHLLRSLYVLLVGGVGRLLGFGRGLLGSLVRSGLFGSGIIHGLRGLVSLRRLRRLYAGLRLGIVRRHCWLSLLLDKNYPRQHCFVAW